MTRAFNQPQVTLAAKRVVNILRVRGSDQLVSRAVDEVDGTFDLCRQRQRINRQHVELAAIIRHLHSSPDHRI